MTRTRTRPVAELYAPAYTSSMTLGQRLKQRRMTCGIRAGLDEGYAQTFVAEKAGVTQSHYSYCESDERRATLMMLIPIAMLYGMTVPEAFPEFKPTAREKFLIATLHEAANL